MARPWEADSTTGLKKRLGKSPQELGLTTDRPDCPDIWELDNGDIAVIGRDLTDSFAGRLPDGVSIGADERLVVIPRKTMLSATKDMPSV